MTSSGCTMSDRSSLTKLFDELASFTSSRYESLREWALSRFDRQIHYFDQMLHHETLKQWEDQFQAEMNEWLHLLTPEMVLEQIKTNRDAFDADPFPVDPNHPFVLRHGDFHGRNILVRYNLNTFCSSCYACLQLICLAAARVPLPYLQSSTGTLAGPKHYLWQTNISRSSLIQKIPRRQKSRTIGKCGSRISLAGYQLTMGCRECGVGRCWDFWRRKSDSGSLMQRMIPNFR